LNSGGLCVPLALMSHSPVSQPIEVRDGKAIPGDAAPIR
jgi:hypothetical protein